MTVTIVHPHRTERIGVMAFRVLRQAGKNDRLADIAYEGLYDILKKMSRAGGETAFVEMNNPDARKALRDFAFDYVKGLLK